MFFPVRPNAIKNRKTKSPSTSESQSPSSAKRASQGQQGRTSRTSTKETKSSERTAHSSTSSLPHRAPLRRSSMPGLPDTASQADTASFLESRTSLPYPTFSKAHSKEDVRHRDIPTPDPTDLTAQKENGRSQDRAEHHHAPPSPPLTGLDQESSQRGSATSKQDEKEGEKPKVKRGSIRIRTTEVNRSSSSLRSKKDDSTKRADSTRSSKTTTRSDTPRSKASRSDKENLSPRMTHQPSKSKLSDERKLPKRSSRSTMSPSQSTVRDAGTESMNGSDATSIAPNQQYNPPRKLTSPPAKPPSRNQTRSAASHRHTPSDDSIDYGRPMMPGPGYGAPPPPPPPPQMPITVPRVDYLLQHGGLDHRVPRTLLPVPAASDPFAHSAAQPQRAAADVFEPFSRLLDDYQKVMSKNGSLAVATGYRSVARRLLDRLEAVFARDISSEPCNCTMCDHNDTEERPEGVSWGEVLELVSGRRELPMWPPFTMAASNVDAEIPDEEHIPMQKLDVDVPEEYRDHFIRQSRKTKVAVDKWLSEQTDSASSAPEEVDDETLTFAMLTYLEPHQRSVFCALLGINSSTPVPRSDDEKPRHRPSPLVSSSQAIQRLYRLRTLPRDPETAMFMLNHPDLHHVLATLAAITDDEWEILISGRFDGFLRSGIEDPVSSPNPRWSGSRSNTPFSGAGVSRGPTPNYMDGSFRPASQATGGPSSPASFGGPIALDEETEIAALAEIERDIFRGMEALEDAFEALHLKAEVVRLALRERGAGLSVANQNRRGSYVEARLGTPASGVHAWESGTEDDFLDDDRSLAPDDSASNISSNRRRRPKRRTERRTPAPVEEEEEDEDLAQVHRRESRNSRRR